MLLLFIDTVHPRNSITLCHEKKILAKHTWIPHQNEAEKILPSIFLLLKQEEKELSDITHILVVTGPGKFTSSRVGIVVANTLSHELNIPIWGISKHEMLVQRLLLKKKEVFPLSVIIESDRGDYFSSLFIQENTQSDVLLVPQIPPKGKQHQLIFLADQTIGGTYLKKNLGTIEKAVFAFSKQTFLFQHNLIQPLYVRAANITVRKKR